MRERRGDAVHPEGQCAWLAWKWISLFPEIDVHCVIKNEHRTERRKKKQKENEIPEASHSRLLYATRFRSSVAVLRGFRFLPNGRLRNHENLAYSVAVFLGRSCAFFFSFFLSFIIDGFLPFLLGFRSRTFLFFPRRATSLQRRFSRTLWGVFPWLGFRCVGVDIFAYRLTSPAQSLVSSCCSPFSLCTFVRLWFAHIACP